MQGALKRTSGRSIFGAPRCAPLRLSYLLAHGVPLANCSKHVLAAYQGL
jgi:hypothetical protein